MRLWRSWPLIYAQQPHNIWVGQLTYFGAGLVFLQTPRACKARLLFGINI